MGFAISLHSNVNYFRIKGREECHPIHGLKKTFWKMQEYKSEILKCRCNSKRKRFRKVSNAVWCILYFQK